MTNVSQEARANGERLLTCLFKFYVDIKTSGLNNLIITLILVFFIRFKEIILVFLIAFF